VGFCLIIQLSTDTPQYIAPRIVRVLISLTVILVETTNLATFVSPLMIVCLASKYVGDVLFKGEGIYDEILHLRKIPFMEPEAPEITKRLVMRATDIMSKEFVKLDRVMRVADVLLALQQNNHLDFLVTDSRGVMIGSISRETLITIIWNKKAAQTIGESESNFQQAYSELSYDEFDFDLLDRTNKELSEHFNNDDASLQQFVNIAHFMDLAPITFAGNGSAERACEYF